MFKGRKYCTKGVQERIPTFLQNILWYMVEIMDVETKDYFQVFQFIPLNEDGHFKQRIIHSQEEPAYKEEVTIQVEQPIREKVYVIDEGDHCTVLLAEEY